MKKYYLGVDVGTYESKGVLVDEDFRPAATFAVPHVMENPRPNFFEMDAESVWWGDFCKITRGLMAQLSLEPKQIISVGTSVMGCDCLPVDENCHPLRKAILYGIDARAEKQIRDLYDQLGEQEVLKLFGHRPDSDDVACKILWLRDNEPEVWRNAHKFLTGSSYMTAKLTGNYTIDNYLAKSCFLPLYREDGTVDSESCSFFCRPEQLAACAAVTDVAGFVTAEAAAQTGLAEGTPVIVGTGDSTAESIAGGLTTPGNILLQFGSTMFYTYCVDQKLDSCPDDHFPGSHLFTVPGTYAIAGGTNCCGILTRWVRDTLYAQELAGEKNGGENAYSIMAQEAAGLAPGSEGLIVLPYLYGERSPIDDPSAKGVIFGLTGSHSRAHINRAALEAVAYSTATILKGFAAHGCVPESITVAGGGTKNAEWMQILADVLEKPVCTAQSWQTASYGDAVMSAIGCGRLKDFRELKQVVPKAEKVLPNPDNAPIYHKYLALYEQLYTSTAQLMHQLP